MEKQNKAEQDLEDSRRRFENVAENIPGMVFSVIIPTKGDPEFLYFSQQKEMPQQFRFLPGNKDYKGLGTNLHPEDRSPFLHAVSQAVKTGENFNFSGRWLDQQGEFHWGHMSASVEYKDKDAILNGVLLDITDQKILEERLNQSKKMEAVGRLAGGIAHDFNNLLVPISGYMELAMQNIPKENEEYGFLQTGLETVDKAARLTDQILSFGRKKKMNCEDLNLNEVIQRQKPLFDQLLNSEITLQMDLEKTPSTIKADPYQLEQLMMNLVINARDAMNHQGTLTIRTERKIVSKNDLPEGSLLSPGPCILLSLQDTGSGMDQKTIKQIFEPFFTTKELGIGTGLGMSIVLGIIQQHKGHIEIESFPGKGTTIFIYFPVI